MRKAIVLIVESDAVLIDQARSILEREHIESLGAVSGDSGLRLALDRRPDLIVLDRLMPDLDGLDVCRTLRRDIRTARTPILFLTARSADGDRTAALEAGATEYLVKPFEAKDLVTRVRAMIRSRFAPDRSAQVIRHGDLVVDQDRHIVTCKGRPISLTAGEFKVLQFLAANPGRAFSRSEIIQEALGGRVDLTSRIIDVYLVFIRRKLGREADIIETVRGVGYRFADQRVNAS